MTIEYIQALIDRANRSNGTAAQYLATVAGMWADTLQYKSIPKFENQSLISFYKNGIQCSKIAKNC